MLGTLPVFKCPITGAFFRSRNAVIFKAALGESAYEYWGFPENCGKMPWIGLPPEKDEYSQRLVVTFDDIGHYHAKAMPPLLKTTDVKATGKLPHITVCDPAGYIYEPDANGDLRRTTGMIQKLEAAGVIDKVENMSERDKMINLLRYDPDSFIGKQVYQHFDVVGVCEGTVQYTQVDSTGRIFWNVQFTDGVPGDYWDFEMIKYCIDKVDGTDVTPKIVKKNRAPPAGAAKDDDNANATDAPSANTPTTPVNCDDADADKDYVLYNGDRIMTNVTIREQRLEELEQVNGVYFCDDNDTFIDVCENVLAEDKQLWPAYYQFNHTEFMNGHMFKQKKGKNYKYPGGFGFKNPFQKGVSRRSLEKFNEDMRFPLPVGRLWNKMLAEHREKSNNNNTEHLLKSLETEAFRAAAMKAQEMAECVRATNDDQSAVYDYIAIASLAAVCEVNALNVHKTPPPKNYNEAMEREDYASWLNAACIELDALRERGVLSEQKYTLAECRARGIKHRPMPAGLIFDQKIEPDGETFDKNKGRLVINGTPHNMKRSFGPNYIYETYSSTPDVASNRLMQALMVLNGWTRVDFDIVSAYLAADLPAEEQVPVQMQKGMREYNDKGEEVFSVLEMNLYGSPSACRRFVQMRDEWMIEHFNKNDWQCVQMVNEKSMFKFTSPEKRVVLACIHSDDVDCVCENILDGMYIAEQFDKRFSPKKGSAGVKINGAGPDSNMLGIERSIVKDEDTGITYVEMTQRGCITDLYEEYKTEMPKKHRETPVPENCFLSTHFPDGEKRDTSEEEIASNNKRGYKHVVGTLLWLARNCFPELSQGLHLLCRVMAAPYDEAFDAALWMISYCYGQRDRGIRFRSDGNMMPVCLYDASNKPDFDSRAVAGHVVMLAGGPVIWQSKKAAHVGASSSHNEYMAAFHAARDCKWIRDLLIELDLGEKMGCDFNQPIVMLGDNDQATRWAMLGMITAGNKTVRMNYHWVQECVKDGIIDLRRVDTVANTSDLFTKSVKEATMKLLRPGLTGYGDMPPIPDKAPT